eukprot:TRINITY_DN6995_c0_g1_i1.p1 TRINITY_DN6995_c0_g1~~TRINITY_DN6995_c0_g1_i1.p1  ORF type:complete len:829 (+),score=84.74 TRINITY_DN6995_c0_g1_i1:87-2573(+)
MASSSDSFGVRPFLKKRSLSRTTKREYSERILREQKYEGMDFDFVDNEVYHREINPSARYYAVRWVSTIFLALIIGCCTGFTVFWVFEGAKVIVKYKTVMLQRVYDKCDECVYGPLLSYVALSTFMFMVAGLLVLTLQPIMGSGVPEMKGYLNGVKIPQLLHWRTFVVKVIAMVLAGGAGTPGDLFDPALHIGGIWGDFWGSRLHLFRSDVEKRSFVSAGVSAAWACVYGSPIGGLLYSIEEGSSFWSGPLSALVFFCGACGLIIFNLFHNGLSDSNLQWGHWARPGILDFGESEFGSKYLDYPFKMYDFCLYFILAVIGGVYGGVFNVLSKQLQSFRQRWMKKAYLRFIEVTIIGLVTSLVYFLIPYFWPNCTELSSIPSSKLRDYDIKHLDVYCDDGWWNPAANIFYQQQSSAFRSVATSQLDWPWAPLLVSAVCYSIISLYTFGAALPLGILASSIFQGACYGKLIGIFLETWMPESAHIRSSHWAILGAAAFSSGITRLSISLVCLLMEATGFAFLALPIMFIVIIARWVAGLLSGGIYNNYLNSSKIPLLDWYPWFTVLKYRAGQIMSSPARCFTATPRVSEVMRELKSRTHNGFPVIDEQGRAIGFILRYQLVMLLIHKNFYSKRETMPVLSTGVFKSYYPNYPQIQDVGLSQEEQATKVLNLRPYMNVNPIKVVITCPVSRIFRVFRTLGLRHIVVVDASNVVQGIITRKDISKRSAIHLLRLQETGEIESLRPSNRPSSSPLMQWRSHEHYDTREETAAYEQVDFHVSSSGSDSEAPFSDADDPVGPTLIDNNSNSTNVDDNGNETEEAGVPHPHVSLAH